MNIKTKLLIILASCLIMISNVYADSCPSASDWIYKSGSTWKLPDSLASAWEVKDEVTNEEKETNPANTVVRMQVKNYYLSSGDVTCYYYLATDQSRSIIGLKSTNNSSVDWDSIKPYINMGDVQICQTITTNTGVCSWKWSS